MKLLVLLFVLITLGPASTGQPYDASRIFAHNDYEGPQPFFTAYGLQVGYIEADVFLQDGRLMVAHHKNEIRNNRTLVSLYLKPLSEAMSENNGYAFKDSTRKLTLMIDLKTEGVPTLNALVETLKEFPRVIHSPMLQIMISGNVPDPSSWEQYPMFIYFDGRPGIHYSPSQWKRISMISTNFRSHVKWSGEGAIPDSAREKMRVLASDAHQHGKKFRFWATPDTENAWRELKLLKADVIVTDRVSELAAFLRQP